MAKKNGKRIKRAVRQRKAVIMCARKLVKGGANKAMAFRLCRNDPKYTVKDYWAQLSMLL